MSWGIREQWLTFPNEALFLFSASYLIPHLSQVRKHGHLMGCWLLDPRALPASPYSHTGSQLPCQFSSHYPSLWISYKAPDMPVSQPQGRGSLPDPKASRRCPGQHRSSPTLPKSGSLSTCASLETVALCPACHCSFPTSESGSPLSTLGFDQTTLRAVPKL